MKQLHNYTIDEVVQYDIYVYRPSHESIPTITIFGGIVGIVIRGGSTVHWPLQINTLVRWMMVEIWSHDDDDKVSYDTGAIDVSTSMSKYFYCLLELLQQLLRYNINAFE